MVCSILRMAPFRIVVGNSLNFEVEYIRNKSRLSNFDVIYIHSGVPRDIVRL